MDTSILKNITPGGMTMNTPVAPAPAVRATYKAKDGTELDPGVVAITKAVRKYESNDDYFIGLNGNKAGESGEIGAYQFLPTTFNYLAGRYQDKLGDSKDVSDPVAQDKVAYYAFKEAKDKGMTPEEAIIWWNNSASFDKNGNPNKVAPKEGVNSLGIKYDTNDYLNKVLPLYVKEKEKFQQENPAQPETPQVDPQAHLNNIDINGEPVERPSAMQQFDQISGASGVGMVNGFDLIKNIGESFWNGLKKTGAGFQQAAEGASNPDIVAGGQSMLKGATNMAAGPIEAALSPLSGTIKTASDAPGVKQMVDAVKKYAIDPASDVISEMPGLQKFMMENPDADEVAGNLITIGGMLFGGGKAAEVPEVQAMRQKMSEAIPESMMQKTPEAVAKAKESAVSEWKTEVGSQDMRTENMVNRAYAKGNDIPQILTDRGISSHSLIGEKGQFSTQAKALEINNEASSLYGDTIKPLIQMADEGGWKIDTSTIQNNAINYVKGLKNVPRDIVSSVLKKIRENFSSADEGGLMETYGDDLTHAAAETEKSAHWGQVNWSKVGGKPAETNIFNEAMGHGYQGALEKSLGNLGVGPETIKAVNAEVGKLRETSKFLQQINGDTPVVRPEKSLTGRIISKGLKLGAGAAGEALGGPTGALFGYVASTDIANAITNFVTGLPSKVRDNMLKGLEASDPESAVRVKKLIDFANDPSSPKTGQSPVSNPESGSTQKPTQTPEKPPVSSNPSKNRSSYDIQSLKNEK